MPCGLRSPAKGGRDINRPFRGPVSKHECLRSYGMNVESRPENPSLDQMTNHRILCDWLSTHLNDITEEIRYQSGGGRWSPGWEGQLKPFVADEYKWLAYAEGRKYDDVGDILPESPYFRDRRDSWIVVRSLVGWLYPERFQATIALDNERFRHILADLEDFYPSGEQGSYAFYGSMPALSGWRYLSGSGW